MWNFVNPLAMGHSGQVMGPTSTQKGDFSSQFFHVPIVPGKSFNNPNFVNKNNPNIHKHHNFLPVQKFSHIDTTKKKETDVSDSNATVNFSQSLIETIKEKHLDIVNTKLNSELENTPDMCYSRKRTKKNQENSVRYPNRNSKENNSRQEIREMMEIDAQLDNSINSDTNMSPKVPHALSFQDFLFETVPSSLPLFKNDCEYSGDELIASVISLPPLNNILRERQLSVADSEDSFIIFDSGTDDELEFSEESEEEHSDSEEELDSSSSVIPTKRVRFATEDNLCEIHPMIQWSYAYQQARKGPWEEYARDRDRFSKRISESEKILLPIFESVHRENIYKERFEDLTCNEDVSVDL